MQTKLNKIKSATIGSMGLILFILLSCSNIENEESTSTDLIDVSTHQYYEEALAIAINWNEDALLEVIKVQTLSDSNFADLAYVIYTFEVMDEMDYLVVTCYYVSKYCEDNIYNTGFTSMAEGYSPISFDESIISSIRIIENLEHNSEYNLEFNSNDFSNFIRLALSNDLDGNLEWGTSLTRFDGQRFTLVFDPYTGNLEYEIPH